MPSRMRTSGKKPSISGIGLHLFKVCSPVVNVKIPHEHLGIFFGSFLFVPRLALVPQGEGFHWQFVYLVHCFGCDTNEGMLLTVRFGHS